MTFKPDPKPGKRKRKQVRIIDPAAIGRKMARFPICRTEGCRRPSSDPHHIVRKGAPHLGDDVEGNILPLCRECHHAYHAGNRPPFVFKDDEWHYVVVKLGGASAAQEFFLKQYVVGKEEV